MLLRVSSGLVVLLQLLFVPYVSSKLYYTKSTTDYQCSAYEQPCITLDDFVNNTRRNFRDLGTRMSVSLLPGNHSLSLNLQVAYFERFQIFSQSTSSAF